MKVRLSPEIEERALPLLRPFSSIDAAAAGDLAAVATSLDQAGLSWTDVVTAAEAQGVAPLFYYHCRKYGLDIPEDARRTLKGLYARQRRHAEVSTDILGQIVTLFEKAEINLTVLKGAALAHLIYPEPGLRPASDIDLFVPPAQLRRAQDALAGLGFQWHDDRPSINKAFEEKHLPPAFLLSGGLSVSVDLHYNLLKKARPNRIDGPDPSVPPLEYTVGEGGPKARTLGVEDTLRYLSLHFCDLGHERVSPVTGNTRLIWAVDIVGFAARYAGIIDWEAFLRRDHWVVSTLSLAGLLVPLPAALERRLPSAEGRTPKGVGRGYLGWPGTPFARLGAKERITLLKETFFPSEWWLRLYYGLGMAGNVYYHRFLRHPLHILTHVGRFASRRFRMREGSPGSGNS